MQSGKIGGSVLSIDGRNFSSVHGWLRSLLPTALRPNIPVILELTNFSENLREHEFGHWLRRRDVQLTICALWAYCVPRPVPVVMLGPQRVREPSKQDLRQRSPSHSASLLDGQAPLEHIVWSSPSRICGTGHTCAQEFVAQKRCKKVARCFCPA